MKTIVLTAAAFLLSSAFTSTAAAGTLQEDLFAKVVSAAKCQQTINNGLVCDYKISDDLWFSIKDAGGSDTVIGFNKSNINSEFYAVMYFGCISVVPGNTHPKGYKLDYGVFVSPEDGRVYQTVGECRADKKAPPSEA